MSKAWVCAPVSASTRLLPGCVLKNWCSSFGACAPGTSAGRCRLCPTLHFLPIHRDLVRCRTHALLHGPHAEKKSPIPSQGSTPRLGKSSGLEEAPLGGTALLAVTAACTKAEPGSNQQGRWLTAPPD